MSDKKKMKIKAVPALIGVLLIAALGTMIGVYAYNTNNKEDDNTATVSVSQTKLKDTQVSNNQPVAATTVEIQFEDNAIPVGTVLKMVAIVTPDDTDRALVWSSSDTDVIDIDSQGVVTVKGTGTAVVTATVGTVTDAVVIEGIQNIVSGSAMGLPVYTGGSMNIASNGSGTSASGNTTSQDSMHAAGSSGQAGIGSGASAGTGTSAGSGTSGGTYDNGGAGESDSSNGGQAGEAGGSDDNSSADTGAQGTVDNTGNSSGGDTGSGTSDGGSSDGTGSGQIGGALPSMGFSQIMSNVYVCEEGSTYYGEIIVQPNVTIVYIKQRSAAFDSMIQNVLSTLLPTEASQVWSNYLSAGTDRTFTVEGRRVRIVVAANGGHSQIVIYN